MFSAQATLDDDEVKIPLSISMPPLLPSTRRMSATYGNFIRLSYHVKLKITTTGSHNCAWEIPIHVGTTSHPYKCGSAVDMDYVMLRRDDVSFHRLVFDYSHDDWRGRENQYSQRGNLTGSFTFGCFLPFTL